jgi:hypothetical protein
VVVVVVVTPLLMGDLPQVEQVALDLLLSDTQYKEKAHGRKENSSL